MRQEQGLVPAVVFDHVVEFNDVLPLFVLLAALEGLFIFPAQSGLAVLTVNVSNSMKACQQHPLLGWPAAHVHSVGTGAVPGSVPPPPSPPLSLHLTVSVLSIQEKGDHSFLHEPGESGSFSMVPGVTSHNRR